MQKPINDKINALAGDAASPEEFMKKLAELDENGQVADETLLTLNGGDSPIPLPILKWLGYFLDV